MIVPISINGEEIEIESEVLSHIFVASNLKLLGWGTMERESFQKYLNDQGERINREETVTKLKYYLDCLDIIKKYREQIGILKNCLIKRHPNTVQQ